MKNKFYKWRKNIVLRVMEFAPKIVRWIHPAKKWPYTLADYRNFPKGTLAKDIANFLDKQGFDFLPNGHHHDARHVVLGYNATVSGELRMQAFLLGNCLLWRSIGVGGLIFGCVMLPELWTTLKQDFIRGWKAKKLTDVAWVNLLAVSTNELKRRFAITDLGGIKYS